MPANLNSESPSGSESSSHEQKRIDAIFPHEVRRMFRAMDRRFKKLKLRVGEAAIFTWRCGFGHKGNGPNAAKIHLDARCGLNPLHKCSEYPCAFHRQWAQSFRRLR